MSPATVSRFFNEPNVVKEPTRQRIREAADELGYIRDRLAGALLSRFSGTIGLVVPTIDNAIFAELIQAFSARLQHHERTMLIASHGYDLGKEVPIVRSLLERRIDGVVLVGLDHERVPLNMLAQRGVPVISVWNYRADSDIPCIGADNFKAGAMAAGKLVDGGYSDVMFLFPDTAHNDRARDRLDGALSTFCHAGIDIPQCAIRHCPYDVGKAKQLTVELLSSGPPRAILCGNDIIAQGVIFAVAQAGLNVPGDIAVVGIGDFHSSEHMFPALSTIRIPARRIGETAADSIIGMSKTGAPPNPFRLEIPLELVDRGST